MSLFFTMNVCEIWPNGSKSCSVLFANSREVAARVSVLNSTVRPTVFSVAHSPS